jgi:hypothetical protein
MAKVRKSKEELLHEVSVKGQLAKSIAALEAEKAKPKTVEKVWVSTKKLFPNKPVLHIEVPKSATKEEVDAIITKRVNQVAVNPFKRKLN